MKRKDVLRQLTADVRRPSQRMGAGEPIYLSLADAAKFAGLPNVRALLPYLQSGRLVAHGLPDKSSGRYTDVMIEANELVKFKAYLLRQAESH